MNDNDQFGAASIHAVLQHMTTTDRIRLADAIALWLDEPYFCCTPGEKAINRAVTDMVERHEREIEDVEEEK